MLDNKEDSMSKKSHRGKAWSPEQRKIFEWFSSGSGNLAAFNKSIQTELIATMAARMPENRESDNNLANSVICSTVHKAKGLESSNVFLLEGTFFRRKPKDDDEQREEENIMYVAVTRSKGRLVYVSDGERGA
jgi:superfamily I DNA/RNA helicase